MTSSDDVQTHVPLPDINMDNIDNLNEDEIRCLLAQLEANGASITVKEDGTPVLGTPNAVPDDRDTTAIDGTQQGTLGDKSIISNPDTPLDEEVHPDIPEGVTVHTTQPVTRSGFNPADNFQPTQDPPPVRSLPRSKPLRALFRPLLLIFFITTSITSIIIIRKADSDLFFLLIIPFSLTSGFLLFFTAEWPFRYDFGYESKGCPVFWKDALGRYLSTAAFGHLAYAFSGVNIGVACIAVAHIKDHAKIHQWGGVARLTVLSAIPPTLIYLYIIYRGTRYSTHLSHTDTDTTNVNEEPQQTTTESPPPVSDPSVQPPDVVEDTSPSNIKSGHSVLDRLCRHQYIGIPVFIIWFVVELYDVIQGLNQHVDFHREPGVPGAVSWAFFVFGMVKYALIFAYPIIISWHLQKAVMTSELGVNEDCGRLMGIPFQLRLLSVADILTDIPFVVLILVGKTYRNDSFKLVHLIIASFQVVKALIILCVEHGGLHTDLVTLTLFSITAKDPYLLRAKMDQILADINDALLPAVSHIRVVLHLRLRGALSYHMGNEDLLELWDSYLVMYKTSLSLEKAYQEMEIGLLRLRHMEAAVRDIVNHFQAVQEALGAFPLGAGYETHTLVRLNVNADAA